MDSPLVLFLVPGVLAFLVLIAAPLENTQRGRDLVDGILRRWFS